LRESCPRVEGEEDIECPDEGDVDGKGDVGIERFSEGFRDREGHYRGDVEEVGEDEIGGRVNTIDNEIASFEVLPRFYWISTSGNAQHQGRSLAASE
jgi:hypothetical protein